MKFLMAAALVCALVLLVGCTGQPQGNAPETGGQPQGQESPNAMPPAPGNENKPQLPPQGEEQPSAAPSQESAKDALSNLFSKGASLQWQAEYDVTTNTAAAGSMAYSMSQYVKGTEKMRSDSKISGMETRTFVLSGDIYSCSKQASAWTCMKLPTMSEQAKSPASEVQSGMADYTITADGTKQVAGTTANCFKLVKADATSRYCLSSEGVTLYMSYTGTQEGQSITTEMTAKSYSTSVSDSEFELPAQVQQAGAGDGSNSEACATCDSLSGQQREICLLYCNQQ